MTAENALPGEAPWPTVSAGPVPVGRTGRRRTNSTSTSWRRCARRSSRRPTARWRPGSTSSRCTLFVRVSSVDGSLDGITIEDTVAFAREPKARGVDGVDASGGGIGGGWEHPIGYGYQVPFAAQIRAEADIATIAVGLIVDAGQAEAIVAGGSADLVALAREAQDDPNFALHAARELTEGPTTATRSRRGRGRPRGTGCSAGWAGGRAPIRCRWSSSPPEATAPRAFLMDRHGSPASTCAPGDGPRWRPGRRHRGCPGRRDGSAPAPVGIRPVIGVVRSRACDRA